MNENFMHMHETNTVHKLNLHGIKPSFVNFKKPNLNQGMNQIPEKHATTVCASIQESRPQSFKEQIILSTG